MTAHPDTVARAAHAAHAERVESAARARLIRQAERAARVDARRLHPSRLQRIARRAQRRGDRTRVVAGAPTGWSVRLE